jgi:hypothetical protein
MISLGPANLAAHGKQILPGTWQYARVVLVLLMHLCCNFYEAKETP